MSPTWYDVLGVEQDASPTEVRTAWRAGIADLDPSDRRFRSRNEAAEVLLDADRRAAYDASLPSGDAERGAGSSTEPGSGSGTGQVVAAGGRPRARKVGRIAKSPAATPRTSKTSSTAVGRAKSPSGRRVPTWALVVAGVLAVTLVVLAAVTWLRPHVVPEDVESAQTAAEQAIVPVLSYDYRELGEDAQAARSYLTPGYAEDYDQLFSVIADNAPRTQTVVRAEVIASSVVRTAPDQVQVLLFVNRPTTNKQVTEPVVYRDQVTVTMVQQDDEWLVDGLQTTPAPS